MITLISASLRAGRCATAPSSPAAATPGPVWRRSLAAALLGLMCLGLAACGSRRAEPPLAARFYLEAAATEVSTPVVLPRSDVRIKVAPKPVLSEYDVVGVELAEVDLGRCLAFEFTPAAAEALFRLSRAHAGRRLVLLIEGEPVGARVLDESVEAGRLLMFVERSEAELPRLVARLKRSATGLAPGVARKS